MFPIFKSSATWGSIQQRHRQVICRAAQATELRVCTAKVCRRQGSPQVLRFLQDLGVDEHTLVVRDTGCLGGCGNGPNMVILPSGTTLSHVATPADACQVLDAVCGIQIPNNLVQATQLRLAGNTAAQDGELGEAEAFYTRALALLQPQTQGGDTSASRSSTAASSSSSESSSSGASSGAHQAAGVQQQGAKRVGGAHLILCNRAAVRLQRKDVAGALADAQQAVEIMPPSFINGWVRLVDCYYAAGQPGEAAQALARALRACPALKSTPEFKSITHALKQAGCSVPA